MKTEILVITDRSGSMAATANDVIGGYNAFLAEQRTVPGEARVTFTQFSTEYAIAYQGRPLAEAPDLNSGTYRPNGGTALYDAIGRTLNEQGRRIAQENWADLVLVVIITDGEENQSREYRLENIRAMTEHAEASGWKFIYLAANQDAFSAAQNLGLRGATAMNYAQANGGTVAGYATMSASVTNARTMKP
jgi:hypothetical protein